jgi:hypothetical protein
VQRCAICRADDERFFGAPARILLLDGFDSTQLLFPGMLQRACHEPVLGFDSIILAPRPLSLVASALAAECPLPLELSALLLQLPHRRKRYRILIWGESIKHDVRNKRINRQGSNFLTQCTAALHGGRARSRLAPAELHHQPGPDPVTFTVEAIWGSIPDVA